jgi:hypothetical protein
MRKVYILQPVIDQWEEGVITSYEAVLKCVDLLAAYRNGHRFTPILNAWTGTLSFKMEKRDCSLAIGH